MENSGAELAMLFSAGDGLRVGGEVFQVDLGRHDVLMLEGAQDISVHGKTRMFLIELNGFGQLAVPS